MNTENNKLIAEFMGFDILSNDRYNYEGEILTSLPQFYSDWNWLMKVVEKIESTNDQINFLIGGQSCNIEVLDEDFKIGFDCETKMEAVYNACVEFIKWYNQQKN